VQTCALPISRPASSSTASSSSSSSSSSLLLRACCRSTRPPLSLHDNPSRPSFGLCSGVVGDERSGRMIIVCPACQARYKFDESKLGERPKAKTRCAKCGATIEIENTLLAAMTLPPGTRPPQAAPTPPPPPPEPAPATDTPP